MMIMKRGLYHVFTIRGHYFLPGPEGKKYLLETGRTDIDQVESLLESVRDSGGYAFVTDCEGKCVPTKIQF